MEFNIILTVLIPAIVGLFAGLVGAWFQSIRNMKEKKFEMLFEYKTKIYSKLHKLSFFNEQLQEARYNWQINGDKASRWAFVSEFKKWDRELVKFYQNSGWAIDDSITPALDNFFKATGKISFKIFDEEYEHFDFDDKEIDDYYFKLLDEQEKLREAIKNVMQL